LVLLLAAALLLAPLAGLVLLLLLLALAALLLVLAGLLLLLPLLLLLALLLALVGHGSFLSLRGPVAEVTIRTQVRGPNIFLPASNCAVIAALKCVCQAADVRSFDGAPVALHPCASTRFV
jgi:hypothetical protein